MLLGWVERHEANLLSRNGPSLGQEHLRRSHKFGMCSLTHVGRFHRFSLLLIPSYRPLCHSSIHLYVAPQI